MYDNTEKTPIRTVILNMSTKSQFSVISYDNLVPKLNSIQFYLYSINSQQESLQFAFILKGHGDSYVKY